MSRPRSLVAVAALCLALLPATTAPALAGRADDHGHHGHHDRGPAQIDLPVGWQPEGVTTDRKHVFSGSLATGAILRANPRTGEKRVLPQSATGTPAAGIDFDRRRGVIWVAGAGPAVGGPPGVVRAQDARTGEVLATYTPPAGAAERFLNDLVVTRHAVYATDSFNRELVVVRLGHGRGVPPSGPTETLPLSGDLVLQAGFNANGIVVTRRGLLVLVQSNTGKLFRVGMATGQTREIDLGGALVTGGDGLELDHRTLYVVENQGNVAVVRLARDASSGRIVDNLTSSNFDVATTGALVDHSLWVANARFGNPDPANAEYWLTRVPIRHH